MTNTDEYSNPLTRSRPLGGRTGVMIASVIPPIALALFLLFGVTGGWSWSWMFFLLIPVSGAIIFGLRSNQNR